MYKGVIDLNKRVKELRKTLKLTQQEFAERLMLRQGTLAQIEKGARPITERNVKLICSEFGVNEKWLKGESDLVFEQKVKVPMFNGIELNDFQNNLISGFLTLNSKQQKVISELIDAFASNDAQER